MATRDPEIIKREIEIADLSATNCALQVKAAMETIDRLRLEIDRSKFHHDNHVAKKASLEAELVATVVPPPTLSGDPT